MKIIKKFKKSEKGSITIMVLASMLFMIGVITASYLAISNKSIGQDKKISQISKQYQVAEGDMEQEYREVLNYASLNIQQTQSKGMFDKTENTDTRDVFGNRIVIPAGFKVTNDTTKVTEGIVIEDKEGNQFVWVPVGDVYTDDEKTETQKKTITLGRYEFVKNDDGTVTTSDYNGIEYTEDTEESHNNEYNNAIAKDIEEFKTSVNNNNGYYIGRYEAGVSEGILDITDIPTSITAPDDNWTGWAKEEGTDAQIVCKQEQQVWNYVTQNKASELSQNMYASDKFTSDLVNSYAWDTAIAFIQTFGKEDNSKTYAYQSGLSINSYSFSSTGTGKLSDTNTVDKQCNIFDMAGNLREWTTETYNDSAHQCVNRGGFYNSSHYPSFRAYYDANYAGIYRSFRPILYL